MATDAQVLTARLRHSDDHSWPQLRAAFATAGFDVDTIALATFFPDGEDEETHTEESGFVIVTPQGRALRGLFMESFGPGRIRTTAWVEIYEDMTDRLRPGFGFAIPVAEAMDVLANENG